MKSKYKILDLSQNMYDIQPGDMVKLHKGLKVGETYQLQLLRGMRFRHYETVAKWVYKSDIYNSIRLANGFIYTPKMLDLTCVKRRITNEQSL